MRDDLDVYPLMLELLGCLCGEIVDAGLPAVCRCEVMPAGAFALDFGPSNLTTGNGQAWVRLVGAGASFPGDLGDNQAPVALTTRCTTSLAYELEVGISRCIAAGTTANNKFTPPTAAQQATDVQIQLADMAAMKRAALCCLHDKLGDDVEIGLGLYSPIDPSGGMGGGTWQVFVRRS